MRINKKPPAGATWDGPIEDVMARLSGNREPVDMSLANSNALGAIGALVRSRTLAGFPPNDKLKCIDKILEALDGLDQASTDIRPSLSDGGEDRG